MLSDQWFYSEEELQDTPTTAEGWSVSQERADRAKGCLYIRAVAAKLQLSLPVTASACVFLHRFYMRHSMIKYHIYEIAATCLFIAAKVEENARHLKDFIQICAQKAVKNDALKVEEGTDMYNRWWDKLLQNEILILDSICFDLQVEHAHYHLATAAFNLKIPRECLDLAWTLAYDSMGAILCLRFTAAQVAAAAVLIAATSMGIELEPGWLAHMGIPHDDNDAVTDAAIIMAEHLGSLFRLDTGPATSPHH